MRGLQKTKIETIDKEQLTNFFPADPAPIQVILPVGAVIRAPLGEEAIIPIGGMLGREGGVNNRIAMRREGTYPYTVALNE